MIELASNIIIFAWKIVLQNIASLFGVSHYTSQFVEYFDDIDLLCILHQQTFHSIEDKTGTNFCN